MTKDSTWDGRIQWRDVDVDPPAEERRCFVATKNYGVVVAVYSPKDRVWICGGWRLCLSGSTYWGDASFINMPPIKKEMRK